MSRIIYVVHTVSDVKIDADSVLFESEDGLYGIKESVSGAIKVESGITSLPKVSTGVYEFELEDTSWYRQDKAYTWSVKIVKGSTITFETGEVDALTSYDSTTQAFIDKLKVFLADTRLSSNKQKFSDDQLKLFLDLSLNDLNGYPPVTIWDFTNVPDTTMLIIGAALLSLTSLATFEIGREFNYNTKGISITFDRSSKYNMIVQSLTSMYMNFINRKGYRGQGHSIPHAGRALGEQRRAGGLGLQSIVEIFGIPGMGKTFRTM